MDRDKHFMDHALALARETTGLASPNPQVGCVLVRPGIDNRHEIILGEGAHLYDHRDHAEIAALKQPQPSATTSAEPRPTSPSSPARTTAAPPPAPTP